MTTHQTKLLNDYVFAKRRYNDKIVDEYKKLEDEGIKNLALAKTYAEASNEADEYLKTKLTYEASCVSSSSSLPNSLSSEAAQ